MEVAKVFSELEEVKQEIFRRKVKNFQIGEHPSRFKGSGFEIHSINQWHIGEPLTNIDWDLSLRTWPKKIYKVHRVEPKNAPVILIADISPSVFVEIEAAAGRFRLLLHLIGALGFAASYFHDPVGILAASDEIEYYLRPKLGRGQIFYACQLLLEKAAEFDNTRIREKIIYKKSGLNLALKFLLARLRRQCSIVILSDFIDMISGKFHIDFEVIEALSSVHGQNVIAIFLDDPKEFSWRHKRGVVSIRDIETGKLEKIKASRASEIRKIFCEAREILRKKLGNIGVDSAVLSFGDHFSELNQFLYERKSIHL